MSALTPRAAIRDLPGVIALIALAAMCVTPLVWLFLAPGRSDSALVKEAPIALGTFAGYAQAWENLASFQGGIIYQWMLNTVIYTAIILLVGVVVSVAAGYALAVTRFPGRRLVLLLTLVAMVVPASALVLPLFLEMSVLRLVNNPLSFLLPSMFFPFGVYLAFIHFSTNLPREILEAARIDGCSEWLALRRIALPLAKPLIGLVTFFLFVTSWTNYFLPFVMLSSAQKYPLALGLSALLTGTPAMNPQLGGSMLPIHRPEVALAGLLTVVPIAVVFLFAQRHLARGILAGAVKD